MTHRERTALLIGKLFESREATPRRRTEIALEVALTVAEWDVAGRDEAERHTRSIVAQFDDPDHPDATRVLRDAMFALR